MATYRDPNTRTGELGGGPSKLARDRPKFLHYVQFLQERCEPGEGSIDVKDEEPGDGDEDAVQLLHRACAAGSTVLIDFLIGHGFAPVDGHCSSKRLKACRVWVPAASAGAMVSHAL
eukprot:Skav218513  [mRNA]  locus=scaffold1564:310242:317846:+ [translate_table: standard]